MIKPLEKIDILITIFNQEEIIERVLYSVLKNTTTPFNLILIFDGCTDRTKKRALKYLGKVKSRYLIKTIIHDTPNLFETRANNYGFKLAECEFLITVQDDMVIKEYGWEKRLTLPLRKFKDIFAVSARSAQDIAEIGQGRERYVNQAAFEKNTLRRDVFAVRDVGIRGPLAVNVSYLKELNYLNDNYAPSSLDDAELSLRAWRDKKWRIGVYGVRYLSKAEWSKVNAPDSTMKGWESWKKNENKIYDDFREYIDSGIKHSEDILLPESEIDYVCGIKDWIRKYMWWFNYPLRLDKRRMATTISSFKRKISGMLKKPFIFLIGNEFRRLSDEHGFKKALAIFLKNK